MKESRPSSIDLAIDIDRLLGQIDQLNAINRQADGSCCRLALTDTDRTGRDLVVSWMRQAGLDVHIDQVGNIVALQPGPVSEPPVMTGSHIDTVATGGPYDGTLGVLAGLEIIRTLTAVRIKTRRPLAVTVFTRKVCAFSPT